jgi:hypothetical protein
VAPESALSSLALKVEVTFKWPLEDVLVDNGISDPVVAKDRFLALFEQLASGDIQFFHVGRYSDEVGPQVGLQANTDIARIQLTFRRGPRGLTVSSRADHAPIVVFGDTSQTLRGKVELPTGQPVDIHMFENNPKSIQLTLRPKLQ